MVWAAPLRRAGHGLLGVARNAAVGVAALVLLVVIGALLLVPVGAVVLPVVAPVLLLALPVGVLLAFLGVPVLLEVLGLVRLLASTQRRWAGAVLHTEVPQPYGADEDGPDEDGPDEDGPDEDGPAASRLPAAWVRLHRLARRASTWRDLAWLVWQGVAGLGSALLLVVLLSIVVVALDRVDGSPAVLVVARLLPAAAILVITVVLPGPLCEGQAVVSRWLLAPPGNRSRLAQRVAELSRTRTATVDAQAAMLRRIERDLHDGTQAHLVSLGMSIGLARSVLATAPERADALLAEAQGTAAQTLAELRTMVRGIHPPVLAERGLGGAVQAVALRSPTPVDHHVDLPGRFEPALEAAVYFAAAEVLANVTRHAGAQRVRLTLTHSGGVLRLVVVDDGRGGADPAAGSGLRGIRDRLAAFDGALHVHSPEGGPTEIRMELPCAPSSPKTSSSSATGSSGC